MLEVCFKKDKIKMMEGKREVVVGVNTNPAVSQHVKSWQVR